MNEKLAQVNQRLKFFFVMAIIGLFFAGLAILNMIF